MIVLNTELPGVKTADGSTYPNFHRVPTQPSYPPQWQYWRGICSRGSDAAVLRGKVPVLLFPFGATAAVLGVWGVRGGILPLLLSQGGVAKG